MVTSKLLRPGSAPPTSREPGRARPDDQTEPTYTVACRYCGWEGQTLHDHPISECREALYQLVQSYRESN